MNTFEKNLEVLGRFFPEFVEEIRNIAPKHSLEAISAKLEGAQTWFQHLSSDASQTIFVYGLGSGAYYFPCKQWLAQDPERYLVFLEDDLSVVHHFLSTPQANEIMAHPQVIVQPFHCDSEGKHDEREFELIISMFSDTRCLFSASQEYFKSRSEMSSKLQQSFQKMTDTFMSSLKIYDLEYMELRIQNIFSNLFELEGMKNFYAMSGKFENIPAIICGAGPSLVNDIPLLAKLKDRALIFGAGSGMNALNAHGVDAHIGVGIDPKPPSYSRIMTNTAYETPYFLRIRFNHQALACIHGPKLLFKGFESAGTTWFDDLLHFENYKCIHVAVSTTQACLGLAVEMGCNPIILLGVDLAYTGQKRYPGLKAHPLETKEKKTEMVELQKRLVKTKDKNNNNVLSRPNWIRERDITTQFAEINPNITFINAASRGLFIPKLEQETLEKVDEKYLKHTDDLDNRFHAELQLCPPIEVDRTSVREWLLNLKGSMEGCLSLLAQLRAELDAHSSLFPTEKYVNLIQDLQDEVAFRYFLQRPDSAMIRLFIRSVFRRLYHPETLKNEEILQSKIHYESRRVFLLNSIISRQLKILETALKIDQEENGNNAAARQGRVSQSGRIKAELPRKEGLLHGHTTFFAPDGTLLARGAFVEGQREGENLQNYLSGKLYSIQRFYKNDKQGRQEYYYESGTLKTDLNFENGKLDGVARLYHPSGKPKRELHFKGGVLHGKERMWNPKGQILMEVEYVHGSPIGTARSWHANGQLQKEVVFYDSEEHCDYTEWNEEGKLIKKEIYFP